MLKAVKRNMCMNKTIVRSLLSLVFHYDLSVPLQRQKKTSGVDYGGVCVCVGGGGEM